MSATRTKKAPLKSREKLAKQAPAAGKKAPTFDVVVYVDSMFDSMVASGLTHAAASELADTLNRCREFSRETDERERFCHMESLSAHVVASDTPLYF